MKICRPLKIFLQLYQLRSVSFSNVKNCNATNVTKLQTDQLKRYFAPNINEEIIRNMDSMVGLQIGLSHISSAKIEVKTNQLSELNCITLPDNVTKMELHQIYSYAHETVNNLPPANCYIMENLSNIIVGTGGKTKLRLHATRLQFVAMIVAIINQKQNNLRSQSVFFMKPYAVAKLFKLLVGSEIVSTRDVVNKLLSDSNSKPFSSSIKCSTELLIDYETAQNEEKEILGQAILLTLASAELIYHSNAECFKILSNLKPKN